METILIYDRVVLVKELNDKFRKIGEIYEIANILEDSFLLRDSKTKQTIGIVNFDDFEHCFVHERNYNNKWSNWIPFTGFNAQNDCYYKTNRRKVIVKFLKDNVKATAYCNRRDEFNLNFGLQMAYLRCVNKTLLKKKTELEKELKAINYDIAYNEDLIKKMIDSLEK